MRSVPGRPGGCDSAPGCSSPGWAAIEAPPPREILDFLQESFRQTGLSLLSLKALATIAVKKDEPGLKEAARRLNVDLLWFTAEELAKVPVPNPSTRSPLCRGEERQRSCGPDGSTGGTSGAQTQGRQHHRGGGPGRLAVVSRGPGSAAYLAPRAPGCFGGLPGGGGVQPMWTSSPPSSPTRKWWPRG